MQRSAVASHFDGAEFTLRGVDDDDTLGLEFAEDVDEPLLAWGISASEGLEHERPESVGACHAAHHLLADTREKGEDGNVVVVVVVHVQSFLAHSAVAAAQDVVTGNVVAAFGIKDFAGVVVNVYASHRKGCEVVGAESAETLGIDFRRTVSAHKFVFEEDADFRHHSRAVGMPCGGNLDAGQEVLLAVGA